MNKISLLTPAKINLYLEVLGKGHTNIDDLRRIKKVFNTYEEREFDIIIEKKDGKTRFHVIKKPPILFKDLDIGGIDNPPIDWGDYTVTGILDADKHKSHIVFDALVSDESLQSLIAEEKTEDIQTNWKNYYNSYTFAKVKEGVTENLSGYLL